MDHARSEAGGLILYLHGGAYRMGSPACYRGFGSYLAEAVAAPVVVVDYRLAPEHPFPAAVDDAVGAYRWLLDAGTPPRGSRSRATPRAAASPWPRCSPSATPGFRSLRRPSACRRGPISRSPPTPSSAARRPTPTSPARKRSPLWPTTCGTRIPTHPLASPARADLSNLAPVLVHTSDCEVLADDATLIAESIEAAGGEVELGMWPDMTHVWHAMTPHVPEARDAVDQVATFIRARFTAA